jgi:hypothetical protein
MRRLETKEEVYTWMLGHILKTKTYDTVSEIADEVLSDILRELEESGSISAKNTSGHGRYIFGGMCNDVFADPQPVQTLLLNVFCWFAFLESPSDMFLGDLLELLMASSDELSHCKIRFTSSSVRVKVAKADAGKDKIYFDVAFARTARYTQPATTVSPTAG